MSAAEHTKVMDLYMRKGTEKALNLENRGPIIRDQRGSIAKKILNAYWEHGFYVFEKVLSKNELTELRNDFAEILEMAPTEPTEHVQGLPAAGAPNIKRPPYRFAKPLSDPLGGTDRNKGRHPVRMLDPIPIKDSPKWTIELLNGNLHLMDSALRLYGHPDLLAVAEAINGADFVPYNEVTFIKEPGLGPSVAWHQDGTTHWDAKDWDYGAHGFNFMTQLYPSTAGNGVWVVPGSHKCGKVNIRKMVIESGSERISEAVPMVCEGGDVIISNRQLVHGSFANSSSDRRVTLNAGFFPYRRVLGVSTTQLDGIQETYTSERILSRALIISLAINARKKYFKDETPFQYKPFIGKENEIIWNEETRKTMLQNYNLEDMYI